MPAYNPSEIHNGAVPSPSPANVYGGGGDFNAEQWLKEQQEWIEAFYLVGEDFPDINEGEEIPHGAYYWCPTFKKFASVGKVFSSESDADHQIWRVNSRDQLNVNFWLVKVRYQKRDISKVLFVGFV